MMSRRGMKPTLYILLLSITATTASASPARAPTDTELTSCLGASDVTLAVFSKLERGMTPADAAAVLPGADKLDKYNDAHLQAKGCVGAKTFDLHYMKDTKTGAVTLYNVEIEFDRKLTKDEDFYKRLAAALIAKCGPLKDLKTLDKHLLTWGTSIGIVQLSTLGPTFPYRLTAPLDK